MTNRRNVLKLGLLSTAASALTVAAPAAIAQTANPKTYVLVPGAWHGAWAWRDVANNLRKLGHQVYALTNTGLGDRAHLISKDITLETHITDIVQAVEVEELKSVILVAQGFGCTPALGAADRLAGRLRHIVLLDGLFSENGRSTFDSLPPEVGEARRKVAQETSGGVTFPAIKAEFLGASDPTVAAWADSKFRPQPLSTYADKMVLKNPLGNGAPVTYIAAVAPLYRPLAKTHEIVRTQKTDWKYVEFAGGHVANYTHPEGIAKLLVEI